MYRLTNKSSRQYREDAGTTVKTITEGAITFAVNPDKNSGQKDIYDALWIQLFNGGANKYYEVVQTTTEEGGRKTKTKPVRYVYRNNTNSGNYVNVVCLRSD